jgi:hypothetical protein
MNQIVVVEVVAVDLGWQKHQIAAAAVAAVAVAAAAAVDNNNYRCFCYRLEHMADIQQGLSSRYRNQGDSQDTYIDFEQNYHRAFAEADFAVHIDIENIDIVAEKSVAAVVFAVEQIVPGVEFGVEQLVVSAERVDAEQILPPRYHQTNLDFQIEHRLDQWA